MTKTNSVKVTKKDRFNRLLTFAEVQADAGMVEFIKHEIELLERKNGGSGTRKPTANQLLGERIKQAILDKMQENPNELYTVTQLLKIVEPLFPDVIISNQRISAILRKMWGEEGTGEIERIIDKRKTCFKIA